MHKTDIPDILEVKGKIKNTNAFANLYGRHNVNIAIIPTKNHPPIRNPLSSFTQKTKEINIMQKYNFLDE